MNGILKISRLCTMTNCRNYRPKTQVPQKTSVRSLVNHRCKYFKKKRKIQPIVKTNAPVPGQNFTKPAIVLCLPKKKFVSRSKFIFSFVLPSNMAQSCQKIQTYIFYFVLPPNMEFYKYPFKPSIIPVGKCQPEASYQCLIESTWGQKVGKNCNCLKQMPQGTIYNCFFFLLKRPSLADPRS